MNTTVEKISRIRDFLKKPPHERNELYFTPDCVFCTDYKHYMGFDATSTEYNLSRMCDGIVRKAYCIEKGTEFPRAENPSLCNLHNDKWISEHSNDIAAFFAGAIRRNEVVTVDERNPIEVFKLLSDFDIMDFVLLRHYDLNTKNAKKEIEAFEKGDPDKILSFEYSEVYCSIEKEFLANADYYLEYCRNALRKIGKKWMMNIDPKEFDSGYLKMLEDYGPNFARGGIINTKNIQEQMKKQKEEWKKEFEAWLDVAEAELGKGLII